MASSSDIALYHAATAWLDGYDKYQRMYSATPADWEGVAARLPEEKGTYALVLSSSASRAFLVGRTGNLGRMVTEPGFYVYLGSASSGLRGRDKHHLTPVERLRAKWQVDSLRLVCSVVEIWYTASPHAWECPWARCMMALPGARIPEPKRFGATGCEGKCVTHLPFFAEKPSLEAFRYGVSKLSPSGCHIERLVVRRVD